MKYPVNFEIEFKRHNYPGKFIVLEGVDASGKTVHATKLVKELEKQGHKAIYTKEPTDGLIGKLIRQVLNREIKVSPTTLQYLFSADRAEHQREILNKLKDGYIVVCDRYYWSAVAFGMADIGGELDFFLTAYSILSLYNEFIAPDMTFLLDVDPEVAVERISQSHKHTEIYDRKDIVVKTRETYHRLVAKFEQEFDVIDANRSIEEVSSELLNKVKNLLK